MTLIKDRLAFEKRQKSAREQHEFARRKIKGIRRARPQKQIGRPTRRLELKAPAVFSLIGNPDGTIFFLNLVEERAQKTRVRIVFDDVSSLTPDAAMALVATMGRAPSGNISGNRPSNATCRAILEESGFFDHVHHGYEINASSTGRICQRASKEVAGPIADELITLGTTALFGEERLSPASYRVLVEAMQNTRDHANFNAKETERARRLKEKQTWLAMVFADAKKRRVCFAFLDSGVGIFRSAKLRFWRKASHALSLLSDEDTLRDLMERRLASRTGLDHRGKGLPSMRDLSLSGDIKELTIVTNKTIARVHSDAYESLKSGFRGTLIYWEVE